MEKREGFTYIESLPDGEYFVGMTEFGGKMLIASNKSLYELVDDDKLVRIQVLVADNV